MSDLKNGSVVKIMKEYNFNEDWEYKHSEDSVSEGVKITIPHDAMFCEKRTESSMGGINTGWYEGYDYIYTKTFMVPSEYVDKKVIFEFEGVYRHAEVSINGKMAGYRPYGYTNFYVDADPFLNYGSPNEIQVIARNADQPNSRWYSGAGIYRPVKMWVSDKKHILLNGVRIKTISTSPAVVEIRIETEGTGEVSVEISYKNELIWQKKQYSEGEIVLRADIENAKLWNAGEGNLYQCKVRFGTDEENTDFGIRSVSYGKNGLSINGERVILRGACIHHDNGLLGACAYPEAEERKVRILMENGYNAIRSAHNPCSKALLTACDKLGMLLVDEYVDAWYIHKTEYDYVMHFQKWWKTDLKDMVDKDYNHPCVIMYSTGNEVSETAQKKGIELTKSMTDYLHTLDDRPVTCGVNIFFNFLSSIGFGVYNDKKALKEATKKKKKAVGSQFFNDLAGILGDDFMKLGATLHGCDVRTRDAFGNMDVAGYNYGILRYLHDLKKYPDRLILGSETFCRDTYKFWEIAKKNPRLIGDFVWSGMDYLGEVGVGAWEYEADAPDFSHGPGWITAGSGRIDLTGKPLGEAAYTRVAFELEKNPVIAVCPVNHYGEKHSPSAWKMTNAMESWSWQGYEGKSTKIEIYARAASVALYINKNFIAKNKIRNGCDTVFHAKYEAGEITAVAFDENGKEISRSALYTGGSETVLRAVAEQETVKPGALCYIRLKYTDQSGILKPLENHLLKCSVTGGKLLGFGNGCSYNKRGYLTSETDTYYGEALAIIKADSSGKVCCNITDGNLEVSSVVAIEKED